MSARVASLEVRIARARAASISTAIAFAIAIAACSGPSLRPLPPGATPKGPAQSLRVDADLARGVLAYDVAWNDRGDRLASIELATRFELVVRDLSRRAAPTRIDLGPPDWDVLDVDVDSAGTRAVVASLDGTVRVFDAETGAPLAAWRLDAGATAVAFSPDGGWLATGTDSGVLCLRRAEDGALVQCVAAHEARIAAIAFAPGGELVASVGWDGVARVWESPSLAELGALEQPGALLAVAFSPDARLIALASSERAPRRPDRDRALPTRVLYWVWGSDDPPRALAQPSVVGGLSFTPDGQRLIVGAWDGSVSLWDPAAASTAPLARLRIAPLVRSIAISPDGSRAAVAAFTGSDLDDRSVALVQLLYPW